MVKGKPVDSTSSFIAGVLIAAITIWLVFGLVFSSRTIESEPTPWTDGNWVCGPDGMVFDHWELFDNSSGFYVSGSYFPEEPRVWNRHNKKYVDDEKIECFKPDVQRCFIEDFNVVSRRYQCSVWEKPLCEIGREKKFSCIEWIWTKKTSKGGGFSFTLSD